MKDIIQIYDPSSSIFLESNDIGSRILLELEIFTWLRLDLCYIQAVTILQMLFLYSKLLVFSAWSDALRILVKKIRFGMRMV